MDKYCNNIPNAVKAADEHIVKKKEMSKFDNMRFKNFDRRRTIGLNNDQLKDITDLKEKANTKGRCSLKNSEQLLPIIRPKIARMKSYENVYDSLKTFSRLKKNQCFEFPEKTNQSDTPTASSRIPRESGMNRFLRIEEEKNKKTELYRIEEEPIQMPTESLETLTKETINLKGIITRNKQELQNQNRKIAHRKSLLLSPSQKPKTASYIVTGMFNTKKEIPSPDIIKAKEEIEILGKLRTISRKAYGIDTTVDEIGK